MPDDPREMEEHELESFARGWNPNTLVLRSNGYSGPDIKLIAHLRGESTSREQLNALIREREELVQRFRLSPLDGAIDTRTEEQRAAVEETWADEDRERLRILGEQIEELEANQLYTPRTKVLAEIQTLSISTHRDKGQVRPLGSTYPRSITRGPRCLPETAKVLVKDKGLISVKNVEPGDYVQSSPETYDRVLGSWFQGEKPCYQIKLYNGYELPASFDHPISTPSGWKQPKELKVGDLVHIVGASPIHQEDFPISDDVLKMIAYLIGDCSVHICKCNGEKSPSHRIALSIADTEIDTIGADVSACLERLNINYYDVRSRADKCISRVISCCIKGKDKTAWQIREYNDLHVWLRVSGLYNLYSHQKKIPDEFITGLSERQIKLFLRHLFATDGCYSISKDEKYVEARFDSTSETLIDQIRVLLSRLGIDSIKQRDCVLVGAEGGRSSIVSKHNSHRLLISRAFNLIKFIREVGIFGKDERILPLLPLLASRIRDKYISLTKKSFKEEIIKAAQRQGLHKGRFITEFLSRYNFYTRRGITYQKALAMAEELQDEQLLTVINSELYRAIKKRPGLIPVPIHTIEEIGNLPVYDLEVENRHAFVANHVLVHNTIGGSMVVAVFYEHVFASFLESAQFYSTGAGDYDRFRNTAYLPDQMPPLDISISFANEYGNFSWMALLGVEIINEGMVLSVMDIFTENTFQYIARDIDPLRAVGRRDLPITNNDSVQTDVTGSELTRQDFIRRSAGRRNPFI